MKKKLVSVLLCVSMLSVMLTGCAGGESKEVTTENASVDAETADTTDAKTADTTEAAPESTSDDEFTIVMVAKHEGIAWFDDMRKGVEAFGADTEGVNAYQIAPEGGDAAKQVAMVEDLIAQGVDAILVVPNDAQSMKPVLQKAREEGIIVVSHEASDIADVVDYDLEAFKNEDFGKVFGQYLAEGMGGEGKYAAIVGGLTMTTHMQWFNACVDYLKENHPDMELINEEPYEDANDNQVAYDKTIEVMKAVPDIKGFVCFAASGAGSAQALEEKGRDDITCTSLATPSQCATYLKSGYQNVGLSWQPADAGYVAAAIAHKLLQGETVDASMTFDKPGYETITIDGNIVYGNAPLVFTADNVDNYDY